MLKLIKNIFKAIISIPYYTVATAVSTIIDTGVMLAKQLNPSAKGMTFSSILIAVLVGTVCAIALIVVVWKIFSFYCIAVGLYRTGNLVFDMVFTSTPKVA